MRVFVTGIRSKIADELIPILIRDGYKVIGCCRNPDVYSNVNGIHVIKKDLTSPIDENIECDVIVHIAAHVPYNFSNNSFYESYYCNVIATNNLLKFAVKNKVKRIIFTSSIDVYGEQEYFYINESADLNAVSDYGLSKIASEDLLSVYFNIYGISSTVLRLSYVYGSGMDEERFLKKLVLNLKNNKDISLYNLDNILNIINVKDVALAIRRAINGPCGTYNLSENCSLRKFVEEAQQTLNSGSKIIEIKSEELRSNIFCTKKIRQYFGWRPVVSISDGILQIIGR